MKIKNKENETVKAGCVVLNNSQEVLLVSDLKGEVWSFPKGHAEEGESLVDTALREVKEETGCIVEIVKRLNDVMYTNGKTGELIRVAMFKANLIRMEEKLEREMQVKWVTITEAENITYDNLKFLLSEL